MGRLRIFSDHRLGMRPSRVSEKAVCINQSSKKVPLACSEVLCPLACCFYKLYNFIECASGDVDNPDRDQRVQLDRDQSASGNFALTKKIQNSFSSKLFKSLESIL
jgi:hypothetical protein